MQRNTNNIVTEAELEALAAAPKLPRAVKVSPERAAARKAELEARKSNRPTNDALAFLLRGVR